MHLKHFPVDFLMIDRDFIKGIPEDGSDLAITRAIIALARHLRLQVIAEGIETDAQFQFLRSEGCDEGQGYLFSKPVPAFEIENLFRSRMARTVHPRREDVSDAISEEIKTEPESAG